MAVQKRNASLRRGGLCRRRRENKPSEMGNSDAPAGGLTVTGHGGSMNPLLLMYRTGRRWRAPQAVYEVLQESGAVRYHSFFCF